MPARPANAGVRPHVAWFGPASHVIPTRRRVFLFSLSFMVCLAFQAVDFTDAALEQQALGSGWVPLHLASLVVFSVAFAIGIRTNNRAFHGALAIAWLLVCISWGVKGVREPIFALS